MLFNAFCNSFCSTDMTNRTANASVERGSYFGSDDSAVVELHLSDNLLVTGFADVFDSRIKPDGITWERLGKHPEQYLPLNCS